MRLNDGQRRFVSDVLAGKNAFLTGEGGTGKSVALREAVTRLREAGKQVCVCAPTGIAAEPLGGTTIHSAFRFDLAPKVADNLRDCRPSKVVKAADVVVVDEVGMVRRDLMEAIVHVVLQENASRSEAGKNPMQVIVVGDFAQLPPVVTKVDLPALEAEYGNASSWYAFEGGAWDALGLEAHVLDEPMRQADPVFVAMLNRARVADESCLPYLNRLCRAGAPDGAVRLVGTNRVADRVNDERMGALEPGRVWPASVVGLYPRSDMPTAEALDLRKGARVICLANEQGRGYVNGSTGTVTDPDAVDAGGEPCVRVLLDGGVTVDVVRHTWERSHYEVIGGDGEARRLVSRTEGSFTQIPLKPCWAMTMHKSQGQTLDQVVIDPEVFADGQLYVALSRARAAAGVWLTREIRPGELRASGAVTEFYSRLGWEPPAPATGDEVPDLSPATAIEQDAEPSDLDGVEGQLHDLLSSATGTWVRVYRLVDLVRRERLFSPTHKSFSAWISAEAEREGVSTGLLWHRKSAGDFYESWAASRPDAPALEDAGVSEDAMELARKIHGVDETRGDEIVEALACGRGPRTSDLRREWRDAKAKATATAERDAQPSPVATVDRASLSVRFADERALDRAIDTLRAAGLLL